MRWIVEVVLGVETQKAVVVGDTNDQHPAGTQQPDASLDEGQRLNDVLQYLERRDDVVWLCGLVKIQELFVNMQALAPGDLRRAAVELDARYLGTLCSRLGQEISLAAPYI